MALHLPDRPQLAPGIRLAGQMQESAFVDPPWLLEREGAGYVQITRLLHLIAERCDGAHTLEQIAAEVSEQYGRAVSAENVRQLATSQLLAKGFLISAEGKAVQTPAGAGRSLLAINMRTKEIGPETINAATRCVTWLYWPPVLVVALLAIAAGEAWLYFRHGVGGSLHDALYTPGLMLFVLLAIVIGAAIHEIGHAAGLRFGGGEVRGMGAGFYLMYPAFYTDVTDNYRLRRWARLRTDLGGFYFNLLTALGLMGLYAVTGWEFLLLIVVLVNFEVIHQLLPLIRLDGYWILADLTGIPDFFSQMGPFLRSIVPVPWWKGKELPEMKWWGKTVFLLYILVALPFLAFSLFMLVKGVPRILATGWDSFQKQQAAFGQAQAGGDALGMASAAGQMLLLALPTFGVLFTLYQVAKGGLTAVWKWGRPTPMRRVVAILGTVATALLVAYLWAPHLPFGAADEHGRGRPGPLYAAMAPDFRPIASNERVAIQDLTFGVAATVPARPTPAAIAGVSTPTPGARGTSTPGTTGALGGATAGTPTVSAPVAQPTAVRQVQLTPTGARVQTTAVATSAANTAAEITSTVTSATTVGTVARTATATPSR